MGKGGIPPSFIGDQKCDLNQELELVGNKLREALSSTIINTIRLILFHIARCFVHNYLDLLTM